MRQRGVYRHILFARIKYNPRCFSHDTPHSKC